LAGGVRGFRRAAGRVCSWAEVWQGAHSRPPGETKGEDQGAPQGSYNKYEQHAAARRGQQEDEDAFTEVIPAGLCNPCGVNILRVRRTSAVVARSPDRATVADRRSPGTRRTVPGFVGDLRSSSVVWSGDQTTTEVSRAFFPYNNGVRGHDHPKSDTSHG